MNYNLYNVKKLQKLLSRSDAEVKADSFQNSDAFNSQIQIIIYPI